MLKFHFRKLVRNIRYARKIYVWTSKWLSRSVVQKQHFSTYFSDYKSPVTKINVAVNRLPNFLANPNNEKDAKEIQPHHRCTIHLNCENSKLLDEAFKDATKDLDNPGEYSKMPMIEMTMPSSLDPTIAPPGHHVCLFFTQYTPYNLKGGWTESAKES